MVANSGKWLEHLVREIETLLLPEGVNVSVNEPVFDDSGVQIAEFDIVITGDFGSASIKWLIECRDRPSQGTAPGEWIQQLIGRRDIFQFDKVTAVSTTGFSPGADQFAKMKGIELRTVESLTAESIVDWFRMSTLTKVVNHAELLAVELYPAKSENQQKLGDFIDLLQVDPNAEKRELLVDTETGEYLTLNEFWRAIVRENPRLFDGLSPNEKPKHQILRVVLPDHDRYQIVTDGGMVQIAKVLLRAKLWINESEEPISQITLYSKNEGEPIAQSVHFVTEYRDGIIELTFHSLERVSDKKFLSVQVSPRDDN